MYLGVKKYFLLEAGGKVTSSGHKCEEKTFKKLMIFPSFLKGSIAGIPAVVRSIMIWPTLR